MNIARSIIRTLHRLGALLAMTTLAACGGGEEETQCPALVAVVTMGFGCLGNVTIASPPPPPPPVNPPPSSPPPAPPSSDIVKMQYHVEYEPNNTLDNANPAVQALPAGATMNDIVTVSSIDGTTHDITITITGTNDAAVISGDDQANVLEDDTEPVVIPTDPNQPAPPPNIDITDSGTLTITDTDTGEASFAAGTSTGSYGSITIDAAGNWTYTADTTQAAIQQLGTGETLTDTVTIAASDGTTHHIAAVITGVNDAPVGAYDSTGDVSNTDVEPHFSIAIIPLP